MTSARTERAPEFLAAVLAGAVLGATFALAESAVAYLAGSQFPLRFTLFSMLYYVPFGVVASVTLRLGALLVFPRVAAVRSLNPLFWLLAFTHASIVANQQILRNLPLASAVRAVGLGIAALLAVAGYGAVRRFTPADRGGESSGGVLPFAVLPFILAWTTHELAGLDDSVIFAVVLFPLSLFAVSAAAAVLMIRALGRWSRAQRRAIGAAGLTVVVGGLVVWNAAVPADLSSYVVDEAQPAPSPSDAPRPNIVLIVLDTLRADSLSLYGYPRRTTPELEAFARDAVLYLDSTAPAPSSLPSHAALFTGLMPSRHGAHGPTLGEENPPEYGHPLADEHDTLAEILAGRGYATAAVVANFGAVSRAFNLDQGFRYFDSSPSADFLFFAYEPLLYRLRGQVPYRLLIDLMHTWFPTPYRPAEEITDAALAWLSERRPEGQPYFLFLNYMDPHTPYTPRGRFRDAWAAPRAGQPPFGLDRKAFVQIMGGERAITAQESAYLAGLYDGAIAYLDHHLGRLLEFLAARRDAADTWIVITSDHGEALGEHGDLEHSSSLYAEQIHVPLIVRYPAGLGPARGKDQRPASLVDVVPTLLEALGVDPPGELDGVPLSAERSVSISECFIHPGYAQLFPYTHERELRMIIEDGLKYIRSTNAPVELYDLRQDPGETANLAASLPEEAGHLAARLDAWQEAVELLRAGDSQVEGLSSEQREALRALGYIE